MSLRRSKRKRRRRPLEKIGQKFVDSRRLTFLVCSRRRSCEKSSQKFIKQKTRHYGQMRSKFSRRPAKLPETRANASLWLFARDLTVMILLLQNACCDIVSPVEEDDSSRHSVVSVPRADKELVSALMDEPAFSSQESRLAGRDVQKVPLMVVKPGQRVELGCHMLGRPLRLLNGREWIVEYDANDDEMAQESEASYDKPNYDAGRSSRIDDQRKYQHYQRHNEQRQSTTPVDKRDPLEHDNKILVSKRQTLSDFEQQSEPVELHEDPLISLIFWYKDDNPTPIYTLDARQSVASTSAINVPAEHSFSRLADGYQDKKSMISQQNDPANSEQSNQGNHSSQRLQEVRMLAANRRLLESAKSYWSPWWLGEQSGKSGPMQSLKMDPLSAFPLLKLRIESVQTRHSGDYKCRIDFIRSPTIKQVVKLLVLDPLKKLDLKQTDELQHFNATNSETQDDQLQLEFVCTAVEASPEPEFSWLIRWNGQSDQDEHVIVIDNLKENQLLGTKFQVSHTPHGFRRAAAKGLGNAKSTSRLRISAQIDSVVRFHGAQVGCQASQFVPDTIKTRFATNDHRSSLLDSSGQRIPTLTQSQGDNLRTSVGKMIDDFATTSPTTKQQSDNEHSFEGSQTLTSWLDIKLKLPPQSIDISSLSPQTSLKLVKGEKLSWFAELDEQSEGIGFLCSSNGSVPAANVSWSLRDPSSSAGLKLSLEALAASSSPTASSSSRLELFGQVNRHLHDGKLLVCSAANHLLARSLEARLKLSVRFKPVVEVRLKDEKHVNGEGSRQLECLIKSNPAINQLVWLVNGQPLAKIMLDSKGNITEQSIGSFAAEILQPAKQTQARASSFSNIQADNGVGWPSTWHGGKYKLANNALTLTVMNLTKFDWKDEYKCRAINILGSTTSYGSVKLGANYPYLIRLYDNYGTCNDVDLIKLDSPVCNRARSSQLSGPVRAQVDQVISLSESQSIAVTCPIDAQPRATRFVWTLVEMAELAEWISAIAGTQTSERQFDISEFLAERRQEREHWLMETQTSDLSYANLASIYANSTHKPTVEGSTDGQSRRQGFLLCKALNELGWQVEPCVSLLLPPGRVEPSTQNCTIEPLLVVSGRLPAHENGGDHGNSNGRLDGRRKDRQEQGEEQQHVALNVDCSRMRDRETLIFQLDVALRRPGRDEANEQLDGKMVIEAEGSRKYRETASIFLRLTQEGRASRIWLRDIDARLRQSIVSSQKQQPQVQVMGQLNDQALGGEVNETFLTLEQQMELLDNLEFGISASDLISSSESRAIYGHNLSAMRKTSTLAREERERSTFNSQISRQAPTSAHVDGSLETLLHNRQPKQQRTTISDRSTTSSDWTTRHHEIGFTVAAICGTLVLSILTLTLIVILLRSRHQLVEPKVVDSSSLAPSSSLSVVSTKQRVRFGHSSCSMQTVNDGDCHELFTNLLPTSCDDSCRASGEKLLPSNETSRSCYATSCLQSAPTSYSERCSSGSSGIKEKHESFLDTNELYLIEANDNLKLASCEQSLDGSSARDTITTTTSQHLCDDHHLVYLVYDARDTHYIP